MFLNLLKMETELQTSVWQEILRNIFPLVLIETASAGLHGRDSFRTLGVGFASEWESKLSLPELGLTLACDDLKAMGGVCKGPVVLWGVTDKLLWSACNFSMPLSRRHFLLLASVWVIAISLSITSRNLFKLSDNGRSSQILGS